MLYFNTKQPVAEILHRDIVITPNQSHMQIQLQRKHEKLQQDIMKQQQELQRVAEQLRMTGYGVVPSPQSSMANENVSINIRSHVARIAYESADCGVNSDDHNQPSASSSSIANPDIERQSYKMCDSSGNHDEHRTAHESVSRSSSPQQSLQPNLPEFDDGVHAHTSASINRPNDSVDETDSKEFPQIVTKEAQHWSGL